MRLSRNTPPLQAYEMIDASSLLSVKAMKLLKENKVTYEQFQKIIDVANLFIDLYIKWDKLPITKEK